MDSLFVNKIAGAVLAALLVAFGGRTAVEIAAQPPKAAKPGYALPQTAAAAGGAAASAAFSFDVLKPLLTKANAEAGQDAARKCLACHTFEKGGANKVGPNLWGVAGRDRGGVPGFSYSEALKGAPGNWSWENLATYIHDPKSSIPGNKMAFAGVKDNAELADILAYMGKQGDSPPPLPQ